MSRARLIITAVVLEGRSQADVAHAYGLSQAWVSPPHPRPIETGTDMDIAIIGTGNIAAALADHWTRAGHVITFGARRPDDPTSQQH